MDSKIFWGAVIVLIGLSIIFKEVFKLNLPVFKIALGLFLLYLGGKILFGAFTNDIKNHGGSRSDVFSQSSIAPEVMSGSYNYNNVFGSQVIDLRNSTIMGDLDLIELNTVFASTTILLPTDYPVTVEANSVFASTELPEGHSFSFGDRELSLEGDETKVLIRIESNTVFGKLLIKR